MVRKSPLTPSRQALRRRWRVMRMGLQTLLTSRPAGFFIPYRHASDVRTIGYDALLPYFLSAEARMKGWLSVTTELQDDLARFGGPPPSPRFEQEWFPRLDAAIAYAVVRKLAPARIIEVGAGHSTRIMARALQDGNLAGRITSIDPQPRADIDKLANVDVVRSTLQAAPTSLFEALGSGDVLFIDSSHIAMPGSDVDILFNSVLPKVSPGCLVHVHDIFLPDAYPASWAWRGYNEQLLVPALLQGGGYRIEMANSYVVNRRAELLEGTPISRIPLPGDAIESSLWLRKVDDASGRPG